MEVNLELIWKKIDGQLTEAEQAEFDVLCKNNVSFANAYKQELSINNALREMPLSVAPKSLAYNVITSLQRENAFKTYKLTFPALKIILLGLMALTIAISSIVIFNGGSVSTSPNAIAFQDYLSDIGRQLSVFSEFKNVFYYSAALFSIMGLVWLDAIYNRKLSDLRLT